jgi:hypothetical protein
LDVVTLKLQDGNMMQLEACTNDTEFISEVITGRVDLHSPQNFETHYQ